MIRRDEELVVQYERLDAHTMRVRWRIVVDGREAWASEWEEIQWLWGAAMHLRPPTGELRVLKASGAARRR